MAKNIIKTTKKVASKAGKLLSSDATPKKVKSVAAAALVNAKPKTTKTATKKKKK